MKLYVGTYRKYNDGNLYGAWVELTDKESFFEEIKGLHKDEAAPEFMFQDSDDVPDMYFTESSINDDLWDIIDFYEGLDNREQEAFIEYIKSGFCSPDDAKEKFTNNFIGFYDTEIKFADELAEEIGYFAAMEKAGISSSYFDSEAFARDLFMSDYYYSDSCAVFRVV